MDKTRPIIGITMGDPAGIGPEITVKALMHRGVYERCRPLVVGDLAVLQEAAALVAGASCRMAATGQENMGTMGKPVFHEADAPGQGLYTYGTIDVLDLKLVDQTRLELGKVSAMGGNAAFGYVRKVIELAMGGELDATVTNPLNKEALNLAGHHFAGHTEIYAHYTGTRNYTMLLAHQNLRVVHVSTHVSLREACDRVKKKRILEVIRIADQACRDMGILRPRIGVAGLNPHCGENGLFGREELEEIGPAVREAVCEGLCVEGPIPPDSIFSKARGGMYDIVVAMYHDQGHIPLKVVGFVYNQEQGQWEAVEGVNITLGLPIIRTSVDHGTAYDQAGKGSASELSLLNAMDYAIRFASRTTGT